MEWLHDGTPVGAKGEGGRDIVYIFYVSKLWTLWP